MPTMVSTFAQLKAAIEDQTTTEIVVTADIKILSGGAKVNVTKPLQYRRIRTLGFN